LNGLTLGSLKTRSTRTDFFRHADMTLEIATRRHRRGTTTGFMRRRTKISSRASIMDFPFAAVEILFSDKSPDRLYTKEWSGKSNFQPAFQVSANRPIPSENPI